VANRLRALRAQAGKTAADVHAAGIASKAKLARIEAGIGQVKMADVRALCWLYGVDQANTDTLAELALNIAGEGFWEDYGDVMPSWFGLYVELESAASEMLVYDPELVPGVLQIPTYQRAIFETSPEFTAESAERQMRLRSEIPGNGNCTTKRSRRKNAVSSEFFRRTSTTIPRDRCSICRCL